jgi:carbamoylphosphate synthase small subunit
MVGYPESLTDPSYTGQLLCLTFPMVGNYGVPSRAPRDNLGLPVGFEGSKIHASALICQEYSTYYSHWNAESSLGEWLKEQGVPGIEGIDTRMLTKVSERRDRGVFVREPLLTTLLLVASLLVVPSRPHRSLSGRKVQSSVRS